MGSLKEPVIFVIKKNKSALENLYAWLKENNDELSDYPMLLIDDEADHGSVNTHKEDKGPTTINRCIRDLLTLFKKTVMWVTQQLHSPIFSLTLKMRIK